METPITSEQATSLLRQWRSGNDAARDELFAGLYDELMRLSGSMLQRSAPVSLASGDLVNEAAMRLMRLDQVDWQDRAHFLAMSARIMRRILIDHARAKSTDKRKHQKVTLITQGINAPADAIDLDLLEKTLLRLHALDPERADIVELRYFGGLSLEETAEATGLSASTIKRSWRSSRAWLQVELMKARSGLEST